MLYFFALAKASGPDARQNLFRRVQLEHVLHELYAASEIPASPVMDSVIQGGADETLYALQ
jgi:hypothetical protein